MKNKKVIVMTTLLMAFVLLSIGTIAYFRRIVNGNVSASVGDLVLVVNEANAELNETFSVSLNRSEEEPFVLPDDKGSFDINIDSTGSGSDVYVTINIIRTNLPDNLKFYLDENYTNVLTSKTYTIAKSDSMTLSVPVYWFWDGSVDDENDSLFINEALEAQVSVTATTGLHTLYDTIMVNPTLDTDVDFYRESSSTNGIGLMMRDGTQNDVYPIVYYRGNVTNNNVIFGGFCWLMVRTTETGGIKLIYNGKVNDDGSCNNYSGVGGVEVSSDVSGAYIEMSAFNPSSTSPIYVGYMYNDTNTYFTGSVSSGTLDTSGYIAHLADYSIDSETGRHTQNLYNSTIKVTIDAWYESNIKGKPEESLLEDTVWCNDRSIISETYPIENYVANEQRFVFAAFTRLDENWPTTTPNLTCTRDVDKFTVEETNGNGDLVYPIGLVTADEINLVGFSTTTSDKPTTYLKLSSVWGQWTLSPKNTFFNRSSMYSIGTNILSSETHYKTGAVRPSISLKNTTLISSGNGSYEQPYIVVTP